MCDQNELFVQTYRPTRRQVITGAITVISGFMLSASEARGAAEPEISHTAEAIHQEPVFKASPKKIYEVLTDAKQFDRVVQLSGAMQSGMIPKNLHSEINAVAGGAFSLFSGVIMGRQIELVPDQRIVQAWRAGDWKPGIYSIAKFELVEEGSATRIIFDHSGFPQGDAEHLAAGWKANYWEPLGKVLA